jgi:hypothetical protein
MTDQAVPQFHSMAEVQSAFKNEGSNWFSPSTMKWWRAKIESNLIGGRFFITSEQREPDTERRFSVRKVVRTKAGSLSIDTIGEFHSHETLAHARAALDETLTKEQKDA